MTVGRFDRVRLMVRRVLNWRDRVLVDVASAAGETLLALFFSSLWVVVLVITYALHTTGAGFGDAAVATVEEYFESADALQYLTAILSSTTAYILCRLYGVREHISRVVGVLLLTVLIWFGATPLFLAREPPNEEFANRLATTLVVAGLGVWWFSLFTQRRIFERSPSGPSDEGARRIGKKLEDYR